jgi:hypothetical protein
LGYFYCEPLSFALIRAEPLFTSVKIKKKISLGQDVDYGSVK